MLECLNYRYGVWPQKRSARGVYTGQYNTILDVGTFAKDVGGRDNGLIGTVGKSWLPRQELLLYYVVRCCYRPLTARCFACSTVLRDFLHSANRVLTVLADC
jgi:hypothetical protein